MCTVIAVPWGINRVGIYVSAVFSDTEILFLVPHRGKTKLGLRQHYGGISSCASQQEVTGISANDKQKHLPLD